MHAWESVSARVCVCERVCECVCACACVHVALYTKNTRQACMCVCTCVRVCIPASCYVHKGFSARVYVWLCMYVFEVATYTRVTGPAYSCVCACMHMYVFEVATYTRDTGQACVAHVCMHVCVCTCVCVSEVATYTKDTRQACSCVCACMRICMCACVHVSSRYIQKAYSARVFACVCMYACVRVCVCEVVTYTRDTGQACMRIRVNWSGCPRHVFPPSPHHRWQHHQPAVAPPAKADPRRDLDLYAKDPNI